GTSNGTAETALVRTGPPKQPGEVIGNDNWSGRAADLPSDWDPQRSFDPGGNHYEVFHGPPYSPAVDANGNADCQVGQYGYANGPIAPGGKYKPEPISKAGGDIDKWWQSFGGGSHVVYGNDTPGAAGPTYVTRRLGINNIRDVP